MLRVQEHGELPKSRICAAIVEGGAVVVVVSVVVAIGVVVPKIQVCCFMRSARLVDSNCLVRNFMETLVQFDVVCQNDAFFRNVSVFRNCRLSCYFFVKVNSYFYELEMLFPTALSLFGNSISFKNVNFVIS